MLGVSKQTPTLAVFGDTGRFPLLLRHKIRAIGYWIRIVSLPEHHHLKVAYQCLLNSYLEGRVNWVSHIKAILTETGNEQVWDQQYITKSKPLSLSVRVRLQKLYRSWWKLQIQDSTLNPKLRTYKIFKFDIHKEMYLTVMYNNNSIKSVAKFRMSSHKLEIEKGRHTRPVTPKDQRIYNRCQQDVDDEIHFLMFCNIFDDRRSELFKKVKGRIINFDKLSSKQKFIALLSNTERDITIEVGNVIHNCLSTLWISLINVLHSSLLYYW